MVYQTDEQLIGPEKMKLLTELENDQQVKEYEPHDLMSNADRSFQLIARSAIADKVGIHFNVYYTNFSADPLISMDFRGESLDGELTCVTISLLKDRSLQGAINRALAFLEIITGREYNV